MVAEGAAQLRRIETCKRILIYGAGTAAQALLREIQSNSHLRYDVRGFVDDDPTKKHGSIRGVRVMGPGTELSQLVQKHGIDEVMIAIPSATGAQMLAMLGHCHAAKVACKTIPAVAELVEGSGLARQIREVAVDDLLGRTPVRIEQGRIRGRLEDRVVLVTGAAGSIGSELCRQLARFHPAGIVGFEIAESPLFEIDREMRATFPRVPFHAEIGSIQNRTRLNEVYDGGARLRRYRE
jgi:FlaA1/EpsC-like NDP-sugar epimerase